MHAERIYQTKPELYITLEIFTALFMHNILAARMKDVFILTKFSVLNTSHTSGRKCAFVVCCLSLYSGENTLYVVENIGALGDISW